MTLILGLRCAGGLVLASDSQRTQGGLRESIPKLFATPSGILWGTAGNIAIQQELYTGLRELRLGRQPSIAKTKAALLKAIADARLRATAAMTKPSAAAMNVAGLFAWYSAEDRAPHLLRVEPSGHAEFATSFTAVGSATQLALFSLRRKAYMELPALSVEAAEMVVFEAAEDVIAAAARDVALPVQIGVVTERRCAVLAKIELRGLEDTVSAWRERKRDLLDHRTAFGPPRPDTGVRPSAR